MGKEATTTAAAAAAAAVYEANTSTDKCVLVTPNEELRNFVVFAL